MIGSLSHTPHAQSAQTLGHAPRPALTEDPPSKRQQSEVSIARGKESSIAPIRHSERADALKLGNV